VTARRLQGVAAALAAPDAAEPLPVRQHLTEDSMPLVMAATVRAMSPECCLPLDVFVKRLKVE